jgi:hypothetical protein
LINGSKQYLSFDDADQPWRNGIFGGGLFGGTGGINGIGGAGPHDMVTPLAQEVMLSCMKTNYDGSFSPDPPCSTPIPNGGTARAFLETGLVQASYDWTPPDFDLMLVSIPGDFDTTQDIEMAELQIYLDRVIDTSFSANRRLFVDSSGFPVPISTAIAGMGKVPEIAFEGKSSNWQSGINSGTLGDFSQLGTINPFTPGPQVGH